VIEVKTELVDFGALERQLNWYEREAWVAAKELGWHPNRIAVAVLLLSTEANDARLRDLRPAIDRVFEGRARELFPIVCGDRVRVPRRSIASIDPASRQKIWIRPTWIDGRRTSAPYADYLAFLARTARRSPGPTDRRH